MAAAALDRFVGEVICWVFGMQRSGLMAIPPRETLSQAKKRRRESENRRRELEETCKLIEEITELAKKAVQPLRDVWRFTYPLQATLNKFNPLRNNPTFQHWGVVVADVSKDIVESVINHRNEFKKKRRGYGLGVIHELNRVGRQAAYRVYKWMSNGIKAGLRLMRVGQTKLKDDDILVKGYTVIDENPEYALGTTDCQNFTMSLLKAICCTTEQGRTVEEMMGMEKLKFAR